jgi:uncharacterized RDD family membrane protein YckC
MPAAHANLPEASGPGGLPLLDPTSLKGVLLRRILGYGVDLCVIALLWGGAWVALFGVTILSLGLLSPGFALLVGLPAAYHVLTIGLQGATWGQRRFGLVVTDLRYRRPSLLQALVLTAVFYLTVPPTGGLVLLAVFFLPHRRTLHDLVAGTIVLRRTVSDPIEADGREAR